MILYPAIDLKDGQAVRLLRGDMASATVFNEDPAAQARAFAAAGFAWLHLVDLNGAFEGRPVNRAAVTAILAAGGGALGIDARRGRVAVEGWAEASEVEALDLARRFEDAGAAAIIHTDIDRDGALQGVNVAATRALARATSVPVIASGGVASLGDIEALMAAAEDGIEGAIVGRALYDGRIDPAAALSLVQNRRAEPGAQGTPRC